MASVPSRPTRRGKTERKLNACFEQWFLILHLISRHSAVSVSDIDVAHAIASHAVIRQQYMQSVHLYLFNYFHHYWQKNTTQRHKLNNSKWRSIVAIRDWLKLQHWSVMQANYCQCVLQTFKALSSAPIFCFLTVAWCTLKHPWNSATRVPKTILQASKSFLILVWSLLAYQIPCSLQSHWPTWSKCYNICCGHPSWLWRFCKGCRKTEQ